MIEKPVFDFLDSIRKNNNREWFAANKEQYLQAESSARSFFTSLHEILREQDSIENF